LIVVFVFVQQKLYSHDYQKKVSFKVMRNRKSNLIYLL